MIINSSVRWTFHDLIMTVLQSLTSKKLRNFDIPGLINISSARSIVGVNDLALW